MAIAIVPNSIQKAFIDLVSINDDAIDWNNSFPETVQVENLDNGEMITGDEAKKLFYKDNYLASGLAFTAGKLPTVFRFKNPKILANKEKIDSARTQAFVTLNPKEKANPGSLKRVLWTACFDSYREGVDGATVYQVANGNIAPHYLQAFSNAGILDEFASVISNLVDEREKK
jgi:hypothetical protein